MNSSELQNKKDNLENIPIKALGNKQECYLYFIDFFIYDFFVKNAMFGTT